MSRPFERLTALDRLIHEPARLAILTALAACETADFVFLQRLTGLTGGNLSSDLSRLEAAGLVTLGKAFVGKVPRTQVGITGDGLARITRHWEQLDRLRADARAWQPPTAGSTAGPTG